jgi:hypothetical protein
MNIGYDQIAQVRRAEKQADELGFMFAYPRNGWSSNEHQSYLALKPKDADSLPIYARDAQFFTGTLDDVENFMMGIKWARDYDHMLRVSDSKKRERKEQDVRNKKLLDTLKGEETSDVQT